MKKKLALITLTVALVFSTGCEKNSSRSDYSIDDLPVSSILNESTSDPASDSASNTENKGEPTFLICPDGTPVYTSEITEIFTGSEETGDKHGITLEEAERLAREGEDFTVVCSGFAYGYIGKSFNIIDDRHMFKDLGDRINFIFTGEPQYLSTDIVRLETGKKFGGLTVKSASSHFGRAYWNMDIKEFSDKPGIFLQDGSVEFDGELELSGYLSVLSFNEYYNDGGDITFFPDNKSCAKIPIVGRRWNSELGGFDRVSYGSAQGYEGDLMLDLGKIDEITVDTGELDYGDSMVRSTVVIDDIKFSPRSDWQFSFKEIKF